MKNKLLGALFLAGCILIPYSVSASQEKDAADLMPDLSNKQVAVGYYHNFGPEPGSGYQGGTPSAVDLDKINSFYNVITVAFMNGQGIPTFKPYDKTDQEFREQVGKLNSEGRAVLLSLGGADSHIELHNGQEQAFADEIIRLVNLYGFDGLDIDLEQNAIDAGNNDTVIPQALKMVREHFEKEGKHFIISMAPEFPYLRTNGKYVSLIKNLENEYDFIAPQLYNQAGDGLTWDNQWIAQNNDDLKYEFLLGMSKSLNEGINDFIKIPAEKLVLGLPANEDAGANGFVKNSLDVYKVFDNMKQSKTPLKGVMTWSINWDLGKNSSGVSYNQKFSIDYANLFSHEEDTEAPTKPQNLETTSITSNSVSLKWDASSDNVGVVKYNIYENNKLIGNTPSTFFKHSDLLPNTEYHYTVTAVDAAGNESETSELLKVNTLEIEENVPSAPTGLEAKNILKDSIELSWNKNSDNEGVTSYKIYRNNKLIGETTNSEFTDSDLIPDTTYLYTVTAINSIGESDASPILEVKTKPDTGEVEWQEGMEYNIGDKVTYKGHTYICLQAHTSISEWAPDLATTLWELVD